MFLSPKKPTPKQGGMEGRKNELHFFKISVLENLSHDFLALEDVNIILSF